VPSSFNIAAIEYVLGETRIDLLSQYPEFASVVAKTGMNQHFQTNLSLVDFACQAGKQVLANNPSALENLGALIVVSQSSEHHLPANACMIQDALGLKQQVLALDINQGCSGFVQALAVSVPLVSLLGNVLIITVDKYRSKLRERDRSTLSIFSDAAAAVLLAPGADHCIGTQSHFTDGSGAQFLTQALDTCLHMSGADVYLWTRTQLPRQISKLVADEHSDGFVPETLFAHQASKMVLEGIRSSLEASALTFKNFPCNYARVGNTVSSSIPILMAENNHLLQDSRGFVIAGFGVGLSSSVVAIRQNHIAEGK
jgi:3-oxoacyl-[acyl-carrier-protein] synthase-3